MPAGFLSFCLETKGPKIQGRHQGPTALGNRPSPHVGRARAPFPAKVWHSHSLRAKQPCSYPRWHVRWLGIYGCGILESACLNMKTRHCISGCGWVVLSGLGWAAAPYTITERQHPRPLPSWRTGIRHPLHRQRTKPSSSLRVIARPHSVNTEEAIHL